MPPPHWHCCLLDAQMKAQLLPRLLHARLECENQGVRLYAGLQLDCNAQKRSGPARTLQRLASDLGTNPASAIWQRRFPTFGPPSTERTWRVS